MDHRVEIRADPEMRWPLACDLERATGSGEPRWTLPSGWLNPGETYYWHVRAKDKRGAWSDWSQTFKFVAAKGDFRTKESAAAFGRLSLAPIPFHEIDFYTDELRSSRPASKR